MYVPRSDEEVRSRLSHLKDPDTGDVEDVDAGVEDVVGEFLRLKDTSDKLDEASNLYSDSAKRLLVDLLISQTPALIDRNNVREVAQQQRDRFFGCLSLPFSLCFFVFFAASVYYHEDITNVYFIESGLRENIGAGIDAVDSISGSSGIWSWINTVLMPNVFNQKSIYGELETDKSLWNRVLMYNQLTGPLVIEQTRSKKELCYEGDGIYGDMVCYPMDKLDTKPIAMRQYTPVSTPLAGEYSGGTVTAEERRAFWSLAFSIDKRDSRRLSTRSRLFVDEHGRRMSLARRLRTMRTEYQSRLPGGSDPTRLPGGSDNKYVASFFPNTPYTVTTQHLAFLQNGGWIDEQTRRITVKFMLLNAEVGRPRLEQVQIVFHLSRGGGVFARMTLETIFLTIYDGAVSMGFDTLFAIFLLIITGIEIAELINPVKERRIKKHLVRPWTILEMLIIIFGWLTLFGYVYQNTFLEVVRKDVRKVIDYSMKDLPPETTFLTENLQKSAEDMVWFSSWFRLLQAEYHLIVMFRFFTSFYAQPRLGVITSTLSASVIDIIHFLIVLLPTFMAYSISGVFLFGRRMKEFSTLNAAVGVCFKIAMEGEYDWDEMSKEHYYTALIWTGTFMLLICQLMINIVLAIVLDIYTVQRQAAGNSETVGTTLFNLYTRFLHFRVWVSNKEIIEKSAQMKRLISREDMLEIFPGMCDEQLDPFMFAVKYASELNATHKININDSMKMTMAVKLAIDKVNLDMYDLQDGDKSSISKDELQVESGHEWLPGLVEQMASHSHWMLALQWHLQQLQWQWSGLETVWGKDAKFGTGAAAEPSSSADTKQL